MDVDIVKLIGELYVEMHKAKNIIDNLSEAVRQRDKLVESLKAEIEELRGGPQIRGDFDEQALS